MDCRLEVVCTPVDRIQKESLLEGLIKGPLQYLLRPLLGKKEFAVTQHMYAFIGPNLDNIH